MQGLWYFCKTAYTHPTSPLINNVWRPFGSIVIHSTESLALQFFVQIPQARFWGASPAVSLKLFSRLILLGICYVARLEGDN